MNPISKNPFPMYHTSPDKKTNTLPSVEEPSDTNLIDTHGGRNTLPPLPLGATSSLKKIEELATSGEKLNPNQDSETDKKEARLPIEPIASTSKVDSDLEARMKELPTTVLDENVKLSSSAEIPPQRSSVIRATRVQAQMNTDSKGNVMPQIKMSSAGRYRAMSLDGDTNNLFHVDDNAVKRASLLRWIDWTGDTSLRPAESMIGGSNDSTPISSKDSMGSSSGSKTNVGELERWKQLQTRDEVTEESETTTELPAVTLSLEKSQRTARFNMATVVRLKQLKKNLRNKINTAANIATDKEHEEFIKAHTRNVAIEIPLSLEMTLDEEINQILVSTHKEYEKVLGKKHPLTRDASNAVEQLKTKSFEYSLL